MRTSNFSFSRPAEILFILLGMFLCSDLYGQSCEPDTSYAVEGQHIQGLFPLPSGIAHPDGSISEGLPPAIVGEPYEFQMTIFVPDSVDIFGNVPSLSRMEKLNYIEFLGLNEDGVPPGISFRIEGSPAYLLPGNNYCGVLSGTPQSVWNQQCEVELNFSCNVNIALENSEDLDWPANFDSYCFLVEDYVQAESLGAEEIVAYPNPAKEFVRLPLPVVSTGETLVRAVDLGGNLVVEELFVDSNGDIELNVATWSSGIYLLEVRSETSRYKSKVVVCN